MAETLPGDLGEQRVAPLFMGGVPVGNLADALARVDNQAGQRQNAQTRFWATPVRAQEQDPIRDILEVDLSTTRLINTVSFDLAHFPHRAALEYSPTSTDAWTPVLDQFGSPVVVEIIDSNPPVLPQNTSPGLAHPQHFGAGHWLPQDFKIDPIQASRLRLVLTRPFGGAPPINTQGATVPYSLGVRSFVTGYRVDSRADIPAREMLPGSLVEHRPIEYTRDLLGSTISFSERENLATHLLSGGIWRSEPQPLPYAVVNLYADVQDYTSGTPLATVIDRFFIDPITSGCSVNVYYTNDDVPIGVDDPWQYVNWTPVGRDFALRRGLMRINPTKARYFKFEFTDLAPEPYEADAPTVRLVRLFPDGMEGHDPITRSGNDGGAGTRVAGALDGILRFADGNNAPVTQGLTDLSRGYSPTEVFYSKDPAAAARLRELSEFYNYMPWQGGTQAPHWPGTQQHNYLITEVLHDQRVAFYVALSSLVAFRLNYDFNEDSVQYLEYFLDDSNIDSLGGWLLTDQDLATPTAEGGPWQATSKTMRSRSNIRGIQYATNQSPPLQLLPDDDFNSGATGQAFLLDNWQPFGIGEDPPAFVPTNDYNTDIGTTVMVTREGTTETPPVADVPHRWSEIGLRYGTYDGIENAGLTYGDLESDADPTTQSRVGGIFNKTVITPALGSRIYAAVRVLSRVTLEEPLWVQIYDTLSGKVLAEAPHQVVANQITEWDVSLDTGSSAVTSQRTWADVEGSTYGDYEDQLWTQVASSVEYTSIAVVVRLVQKGAPNASWYIDTLSLFEDSILWEFSNDDGATWYQAPGVRNNPDGALLFPDPVETAYANTYEAIEGSDPDPSVPTWGDLSGDSWWDLEHVERSLQPDNARLRWRVTCQRPGQHVNALSIRPWYVGTGLGEVGHDGANVAGPNAALYDHYQPIRFDPRYRLWSKPIPQSWYFFFRQFTLTRHTEYVSVPVTLPQNLLGDSIIVPQRPDIMYSADLLGDGLIIDTGSTP
jgi:hypothetical protein